MNLKNISHTLLALVFLLVSTNASAADFSSSPDLEVGMTNPFVLQLQKLLNTNGYVINPAMGQPGSMGNESDYFGKMTQAALSKFQSAFGLSPATGYFGAKTKTKITELSASGTLKNDIVLAKAPSNSLASADTSSCPAGQARALTYWGVTWTFSGCVPYGTFVTGEYYVVGAVTITNINPNPSQLTPGQALLGGNGSMINPVQGTDQGFDARVCIRGGFQAPNDSHCRRPFSPYYEYLSPGLDYKPANNRALNFPINLAVNDALVSAKSYLGYPTYLETVVVLTSLPSAPPPGSFRPSFWGTDRTVRWNKNQINLGALKNISAPSSTPSKADILASVPALPWFEWNHAWDGNSLQPQNNTADGGLIYGRAISFKFGNVALWLNTNQSAADKEEVAIRLIQNGLDIYGYAKDYPGSAFYHDGGHKGGRKIPLVMAAMLLNDGNDNLENFAGRTDVFQEDMQTWIVTQSDVGRVLNPPEPGSPQYQFTPYNSSHVGSGEWGIRHLRVPKEDNSDWVAGYRHVVWPAMIGPVLAADLMNPRWDGKTAKQIWNHEAIFAYNQRYVQIAGGSTNAFVNSMWNSRNPATTANLSLSKTGSGTLSFSPQGTSCGSNCSTYTIANNTSVTITATPASGSEFTGWSGGGCSGNSPTCTVTMNSNRSITATFDTPEIPFAIGNSIEVTPSAGGTFVNVRDASIFSTDDTGYIFSGENPPKLGQQSTGATGVIIAGPTDHAGVRWWNINYSSGSDGWTGQASNGVNNLTVTEEGNPGTTFTLTANKSGTGASLGSISGNTSPYDSGETATVTANASSGASFTGWTGCASTSGTGGKICTVSMNGNKTVTANFDADVPPGLVSPTITFPASATMPSTTSFTATWSDTGSAYLTRLKDLTINGTEIQDNNVTTESKTYTGLIPGHQYRFWVHSGTINNYSDPESFIVFTVLNSTSNDDDGDGVLNAADRCPHTAVGQLVNMRGCPVPLMSNFNIKPDLANTDMGPGVANFYIGKTGMARIDWGTRIVDLQKTVGSNKQAYDLNSNITIANKRVELNSSELPMLNVPATITFYGITKNPIVKRNGETCTTCTNTVYNASAQTLTVTVPGFSTYEVIEPGTVSLTVNTSGNGNGTVTGNNSPYEEGEGATLTAVPAAGSVFTSWSGCTSTSGTTCTVSMSDDKTVTATFTTSNTDSSSGGGGGGGGGGSKTKLSISCAVDDTSVGYGSTVSFDTTIKNAQGTYKIKWLGTGIKLPGFSAAKEDQVLTMPGKKAAISLKAEVTDAKGKKAKVTCKTVKVDKKYGLVTSTSTGTTNTDTSTTNTIVNVYAFLRDLTVGSRGADVRELQKFLNAKGFPIASSGDGSLGRETEYFGPATANALARYQTSRSISPASGFLGQLTRTAINSGR